MKVSFKTDSEGKITARSVNDIAIVLNTLSKEEFYNVIMEARGLKESQKSCRYCCTEMHNDFFNVADESSQEWEVELFLTEYNDANVLTLELDTSWKQEYVEIPINYCPFCGRKL